MNRATLEKWVLMGVIVFAIFSINIYYYFMPNFAKVRSSRNDYKQNIVKINELVDKANRKEEFEANKKFYKYQLAGLNQELPTVIAPEKYVMALKSIAVKNGVGLSITAFTDPEVYSLESAKINYDPTSKVATQANEMINKMFLNKDTSIKEEGVSALQVSKIPDDSPMKVNITASIKGSFEQIKGMINDIENSNSRITIDKINFQGEGDSVEGTIVLNLYGFKDSNIPVYDLWTQTFGRGREDLFSSVSGDIIRPAAGSDFTIALNAADADIPSIVIGKTGMVDSQVYVNNKGIVEAELYIEEKDGYYSYKYKIQDAKQAYPAGYGNSIGFVPGNANEIDIDVNSTVRESDADKAGINLTIVKKTDKNINIRTSGDDPVRPRLSVVWK